MFPIEWSRVTRARSLTYGDFAYLPELDSSRVLIGTDPKDPDYTVAVMLDADVSKCTVTVVEELEGPAFKVGGFRFEGDIESLEKLEQMDDRYGALIVAGKDIAIAARPAGNVGYCQIKVAELEEENPSQVAFAYRRWRVVKDYGQSVVELYSKGGGVPTP